MNADESLTDRLDAPGQIGTFGEWLRDTEPYVRYADEERKRLPNLHHVAEIKPAEAVYVGPVYGLNTDEVERLESYTNPYAAPEDDTIASLLTREIAEDGRVSYPIIFDSDSLQEVGDLQTIATDLSVFAEDYLGVSLADCTFWFSGHKGIHLQIPGYVTEQKWSSLTQIAERFNECDEHDSTIDLNAIKKKQVFRLPGVEHTSTGLQKVQVQPDWSHDEIIRAGANGTTPPETYLDAIPSSIVTTRPSHPSISVLYGARIRVREPVSPDIETHSFSEYKKGIPEPFGEAHRAKLIDGRGPPVDGESRFVKLLYNAKEFSPYANTGNGRRSIAVVEVKGGAFSRIQYDRPEDLESNIGGRLPCYHLYSVGADSEFTKEHEPAPLLLSRHDYEKVEDVERGNRLVVIGGRSRRSIIHRVEPILAEFVAASLPNREDALELLREQGYDVGSSGLVTGNYGRETDAGADIERGITEAARLQQKAETDGIESLSHGDSLRVSNRLLQLRGWCGAREWFRQQYAGDYDQELTERHLRSVAKKYDDLPDPES
ncbi:hypothetical protein [Haloarchaeobius sp. HRN-SO-5]|uniref:hypothetical protein n=1 Tax=Haloarchaeobius sp. HRN-SO-5 TaxID=3446118 RepID=UPI003EBCDA0C